MSHQFRRSLFLYTSTASLALGACDASTTTRPASPPASPPFAAAAPSKSPAVSVALGDSIDVAKSSALARYSIGEGLSMSWSSRAPTIAKVSPTGVVKGLLVGSSMVVLAVGKWRDSIPVNITVKVTSITASASMASFQVGLIFRLEYSLRHRQ